MAGIEAVIVAHRLERGATKSAETHAKLMTARYDNAHAYAAPVVMAARHGLSEQWL